MAFRADLNHKEKSTTTSRIGKAIISSCRRPAHLPPSFRKLFLRKVCPLDGPYSCFEVVAGGIQVPQAVQFPAEFDMRHSSMCRSE